MKTSSKPTSIKKHVAVIKQEILMQPQGKCIHVTRVQGETVHS